MNRYHDQGNSYKDNIELGLAYSSEVQPIIIKVGTWQHPGRHGAGEAESSNLHLQAASGRLTSRQVG